MTAVDLPAVPRVLIAEADPASRELLEQVLSGVRCDARVDTCGDGKEALDLLAKHPYDLVIADWELPGVDGLAILRGLRQQHRTPPLPFILMSRRNDSASVREVLPLAPTAYLTKPLNRENLTQRLQGLLVGGEETSNDAPVPGPGLTLIAFLERRRDLSEGAPLMTDVQVAVKRCLNPAGLDLKLLEEEIRTDPQITGVLIAAANSAAQHQGGGPVQTVAQALHQLGTGQSMNLILGLTLKPLRPAHRSLSGGLCQALLGIVAAHRGVRPDPGAATGSGTGALLLRGAVTPPGRPGAVALPGGVDPGGWRVG